MRKIREILRLRFEHELSHTSISSSVGVSSTGVGDLLKRFHASGIAWPLHEEYSDEQLELLLYPQKRDTISRYIIPDYTYVHKEMRRKGVTLMLLWEEYKAVHKEHGCQYAAFCNGYRRFRKTLEPALRLTHKAGDKMFVDFSGDGIPYIDPVTKQQRKAELFVAALGASHFIYAEAMLDQTLPRWIQGHINAFEYFGGVPCAVVPDNATTAIRSACYYEPDINQTYWDMARHYKTAILPTRTRKPKDKAKVENAVLITQRRIIAAVRNCTFFGLEQAKEAVKNALEELNDRPLQKLDETRRSLYTKTDKPALKQLPATRYEFAIWKKAKVHIDYHVTFEKHYYSVPFTYIHKQVEIRATTTTVEIFCNGKRIASHERSFAKNKHSTHAAHMPKEHRSYLEWTPPRIINWASKIGPATALVIEHILSRSNYSAKKVI